MAFREDGTCSRCLAANGSRFRSLMFSNVRKLKSSVSHEAENGGEYLFDDFRSHLNERGYMCWKSCLCVEQSVPNGRREQVFCSDISWKLTAIQPKSTFKAEGHQIFAFDFKPIKGPPEGLRAVPKPQKLTRNQSENGARRGSLRRSPLSSS
jgi:hypothetical protein